MGRILDIGRQILNDWCEDRIKVGCYLRRGAGNGRHDGATRIVGLMNLGQHIDNRCSRMLQKQCRGIGWKIFVVDFFFDKIYDGFVEGFGWILVKFLVGSGLQLRVTFLEIQIFTPNNYSSPFIGWFDDNVVSIS